MRASILLLVVLAVAAGCTDNAPSLRPGTVELPEVGDLRAAAGSDSPDADGDRDDARDPDASAPEHGTDRDPPTGDGPIAGDAPGDGDGVADPVSGADASEACEGWYRYVADEAFDALRAVIDTLDGDGFADDADTAADLIRRRGDVSRARIDDLRDRLTGTYGCDPARS